MVVVIEARMVTADTSRTSFRRPALSTWLVVHTDSRLGAVTALRGCQKVRWLELWR